MPSTATITAFYTFAAGTKIKSAEVNNNFANLRGHIVPIDPSLSAAAVNFSYDLGADTHAWRNMFSQYATLYQNTTGSVPVAPTAGFMAFYFKSDGRAYSKSPAGLETQIGGFKMINTRAAPGTITAAGFAFDVATNGLRQFVFVTGDTTTGADITSNPQISGGTLGAELILAVPNTATAMPVILEHGAGLDQNGYLKMNAGGLIKYVYDGTEWLEQYRKET